MGLGEAFIAFIVVGMPIITFGFLFNRWFNLEEKKMEVDAGLAVEKAAQYAASNAELEARLRVVEQIVTDGGMQTAAQIEALRDRPSKPTRPSSWKRIGTLMGRYEFIIAIVAIVMFATVMKARYSSQRRHRIGACGVGDFHDGEAARLREEVKRLQERIHVLERITTDRENSLSREIEELRDREPRDDSAGTCHAASCRAWPPCPPSRTFSRNMSCSTVRTATGC